MSETTKDISAWELGGIDSYTGDSVRPTARSYNLRIRTKEYVSGISRIVQTAAIGLTNGITIYAYDPSGRYIGPIAKNVSVYADFDYSEYKYRIELIRNDSEDLETAFGRYAILDAAEDTEYYQWNPALLMYKDPNDGFYRGNAVGNLGLTEHVSHIQSLDEEIQDGINEVGDDLIEQVNAFAEKYTTLLEIMHRVNSEIIKYYGSIFILGTSTLDDAATPLV